MAADNSTTLALARLTEVIDRLLDPQTGCPWDVKQTIHSTARHLLEEAYELLDSAGLDDPEGVREEAGDVAFLLGFLARLTQSRWGFGWPEFLDGVTAKMISRHPHVFGEGRKMSEAEEVVEQWQKIKRQERPGRLLASVPKAFPALKRAHRLSERVARLGFDWAGPEEVRTAVVREWEELAKATSLKRPDRELALAHELGDVLFALTNLARHLGFSAEELLNQANERFIRRFEAMEDQIAADGVVPEKLTPKGWEELWALAKKKTA